MVNVPLHSEPVRHHVEAPTAAHRQFRCSFRGRPSSRASASRSRSPARSTSSSRPRSSTSRARTITANVDYDCPIDPSTRKVIDDSIKFLAVETTDFLGEVFLCQDPPTGDLLTARMYTSVVDHPRLAHRAPRRVPRRAAMIIRYSPYDNYADYITSLLNGVRLGITQGGGYGRVVDVHPLRPHAAVAVKLRKERRTSHEQIDLPRILRRWRARRRSRWPSGCVADRPSRNGVFNENQYVRKDFLDRPGDGIAQPIRAGCSRRRSRRSPRPTRSATLGIFAGAETGRQRPASRFDVTQDKLQMINVREITERRRRSTRTPEVVNAWPITNVDLKYRVNLDGEKTNFYEENQELDWQVRQWVKINFAKNDMSDMAPLGALRRLGSRASAPTSATPRRRSCPDSLHGRRARQQTTSSGRCRSRCRSSATTRPASRPTAPTGDTGRRGSVARTSPSTSSTRWFARSRSMTRDDPDLRAAGGRREGSDPPQVRRLRVHPDEPRLGSRRSEQPAISSARRASSSMRCEPEQADRLTTSRDGLSPTDVQGLLPRSERRHQGPDERRSSRRPAPRRDGRLPQLQRRPTYADGTGPVRQFGDVRYSFLRWMPDLDANQGFVGLRSQRHRPAHRRDPLKATINLANYVRIKELAYAASTLTCRRLGASHGLDYSDAHGVTPQPWPQAARATIGDVRAAEAVGARRDITTATRRSTTRCSSTCKAGDDVRQPRPRGLHRRIRTPTSSAPTTRSCRTTSSPIPTRTRSSSARAARGIYGPANYWQHDGARRPVPEARGRRSTAASRPSRT